MIPALAQWVKHLAIAVSCSVGCRCGSDPVLLWLWHRPVATAPIRPLAWEPPHAARAAQEMAKRQKKKKSISNEEGVITKDIKNFNNTVYSLCNKLKFRQTNFLQ